MDFDRKTVPWLKDYLTSSKRDTGIQVTDQGRGKRKAGRARGKGTRNEITEDRQGRRRTRRCDSH